MASPSVEPVTAASAHTGADATLSAGGATHVAPHGASVSAELAQRYKESQAINRMVDAVTRADDLERIYAVALDELIATVHADRAAILLFDPDDVMRFKAWRGLSEEYRGAVEGHSPWRVGQRDPQPVLVSKVRDDATLGAFSEVFEREGIRALGFIPLVDAGTLIGKFMIYFDDTHEVSADCVRVAQTIAGHIAFAIARKRADVALRESEERYRRLVELSPVAVAVHAQGKLLFLNPAGAELIGASSPDEVLGRNIMDFVHPDYRALVLQRMRDIANGAQMLPPMTEKFVKMDGSVIDVEVAAIGFTYQGKAASQIVATDITERRRAEDSQRILAEAGALMNSSLEYAETLRSITRLVVPSLADWCIVDLVDDAGGFDRIAAASADPADHDLARRLIRHYDPIPDAPHGVTHTFVTRTAEVMPHVDPEKAAGLARDPEHAQMIREVGMRSFICVPMLVRGRITGVITYVQTKSGRRFSHADLPLFEELARRAALAVDNARLYREAHEANAAKSNFLARMSHELRTPLNAIGGYTELLEMGLRGPVTPQQHEDLTRIQRSQKHLLGLINDLLSFAKIESGHVDLNIEPTIVEDALQAVRALIEPQALAKGVVLESHAGGPACTCSADHDKLRQIVLNLLSNAVKFTSTGGHVWLDWEASDTSVVIRVRDEGPGIPPDKLDVIFEPFVQLAAPLTRVSEGAGLGLAISRELARAMRGDVAVMSTLGSGSTFTLTLPLA